MFATTAAPSGRPRRDSQAPERLNYDQLGGKGEAMDYDVPDPTDSDSVVIKSRDGEHAVWTDSVCDLSTEGLTHAAAHEVWNYAFLVNRWLATRRGQKVKIKSNNDAYNASRFTADVRKKWPGLFPGGEGGTQATVVAHVPDTALSGDGYACAADEEPATRKPFTVPGWMPMTKSANLRVALITHNATKDLSLITVNGKTPTMLSNKGIWY